MTTRDNWQRRRIGFAPMSAKCMAVLQFLADAKAKGWPFVALDGVHKRTINALFEYDLIDISRTGDDVRYKITDRGERTRKAYETPTRRSDGMCPDCGIRPRAVSKSGKRYGYCTKCRNKYNRNFFKFHRVRPNADKLCAHCGKKPRAISRSGYVYPYCRNCWNSRSRKRKVKLRTAQVRQAQRGVILICTVPGCTNPRHVSKSTVREYCYEHYSQWQKQYQAKRKAARFQQVVQR